MMGDRGARLSNEREELGARHNSQFCIGGVSVDVAGARTADVTLVPSLIPFRVETGVSDINIQVEWTGSLLPRDARQLFDSGTTWRLYEDGAGFQFDFNAPVFGRRPYKRLLIDRRFRIAALQMSEEAFDGFPHVAEPLEYPLDELLIMHRLTQERAIELHSCGISGPDDQGNLFVGHSGAGKSTTARLWASRNGVEILSDDRIIVRREAGEILMYGTPWHGEAAFALPACAPLRRILVLEQGLGNVLTRLSPSQAVGELFARSFVPFHRHEYVNAALEFLQDVAATVPCYRYSFEPHQGAVERVLSFRD
jgi:hypothetical protein